MLIEERLDMKLKLLQPRKSVFKKLILILVAFFSFKAIASSDAGLTKESADKHVITSMLTYISLHKELIDYNTTPNIYQLFEKVNNLLNLNENITNNYNLISKYINNQNYRELEDYLSNIKYKEEKLLFFDSLIAILCAVKSNKEIRQLDDYSLIEYWKILARFAKIIELDEITFLVAELENVVKASTAVTFFLRLERFKENPKIDLALRQRLISFIQSNSGIQSAENTKSVIMYRFNKNKTNLKK